METVLIATEDLVGGREKWDRVGLEVEVPANCRAFHLTNDLADIAHLSGEKSCLVPVFWVDSERLRTMDTLWSKFENATKFVVTSGSRKDYVGFVRLVAAKE